MIVEMSNVVKVYCFLLDNNRKALDNNRQAV